MTRPASVYQSMVVPLLAYNCIANLNLNRTQLGRLCSLGRRVSQILGEPMTSIFNLIKKHGILIVEKCLFVEVCPSYRNYFQKLEHKVSTRNNGKLLKIPKVKTSSSWMQESSILYPWKFVLSCR